MKLHSMARDLRMEHVVFACIFGFLMLGHCMGAESEDGKLILAGSNDVIIDYEGYHWGLLNTQGSKSYVISVDGVPDNTTGSVLLLVYLNRTIWQENMANRWWSKHTPSDYWFPWPGTSQSPLPNACSNDTSDFATTCHGFGHCDYMGQCRCTDPNYKGPYCSNCSASYAIFPNCATKCGDGTCQTSEGEDCLSCPQDCPSPCGKCGDGVCNGKESCSSCVQDCGPCKTSCLGSPECSGHGTCIKGVCACNASWTGPACADVPVPISFNLTQNTSASTPGVELKANQSSSQSASFFIGLTEIEEINPNGNIVKSFVISNLTRSFTRVDDNNSPSGATKYVARDIIGGSSILLELTMWSFSKPATMVFANQTLSFPAGALKLNMAISAWPFASIANSLLLKMLSTPGAAAIESNPCGTFHGLQQGSDLRWIQIANTDNSLYVQFLPYASIDGQNRSVSFRWLGLGVAGVYIPHFWQTVEIDPNYQMLLNVDNPPSSNIANAGCKKNEGIPTWKKAAIAVPICFVVALSAAVAIVFMKRKAKQKRKKATRI